MNVSYMGQHAAQGWCWRWGVQNSNEGRAEQLGLRHCALWGYTHDLRQPQALLALTGDEGFSPQWTEGGIWHLGFTCDSCLCEKQMCFQGL